MLKAILDDHITAMFALESQLNNILHVGKICSKAIQKGRRIFIFGNGGSAADAQHFAAELTGRFEKTRRPLPAIALSTDTSAITAISNDFGFEKIYQRQLEALSQKGDVVIGISTSGKSKNIRTVFQDEKFNGLTKILLTGETKPGIDMNIDYILSAPSHKTARIQELHIFILHCICAVIDKEYSND